MAGELVVAVREGVCFHDNGVADRSLDRETASIDLRLHVLDSNAATIG